MSLDAHFFVLLCLLRVWLALNVTCYAQVFLGDGNELGGGWSSAEDGISVVLQIARLAQRFAMSVVCPITSTVSITTTVTTVAIPTTDTTVS